ncbi:MAG: tRNA pseudouridine(55) synthase TruB [Thermonemataceae bacterium]
MKAMNFQAGEVILIDKPYRWTSFDVVKKLRGALKVKKIGHAGTLDPLATGLLILCTGKKTKEINHYQAQEKEYEGTLVLGKTTPSVDLETDFDQDYDISHISDALITETLPQFIGDIQQVPPIYSAIKVKGKRVYQHARKGEVVALEPRQVTVSTFEITDNQFPTLHFRIVCSKGTYIRSLVRDFGEALGAGAYLASLCRTRIGSFTLKQAYALPDFIAQHQVFTQQ